jgi:hypothetical protein
MIKRLTRGAIIAIAAVMLLLPFYKANAGIPVGTWRAHPAYNDATFSLKAFGYICVLSDGAVYFYDPVDNGLYTIDKTGGLGDTDISAIGYCNSEKAVLLVYSNGNIDILYDDFTIFNFTDLKNNSTGNVQVNELKIVENIAYISTNVGLVIFDIKRREIKNTYRFDSPVFTSVLLNDSLFCSTEKGLYLGITTYNLLDPNNWSLFTDIRFRELFEFEGELSGYSFINEIFTINRTNAAITKIKDNISDISYLSDGRLALIQDTVVTVFDNYSEYLEYHFEHHVNHIMIDDSDLWVCHGVNGLFQYSLTDDGIICMAQFIKPNSPRRNWFHSVSWPQKGRLLVVGGCHNYQGIDYPGTVMIYENDRWSYLEDNLKSITGLNYVNLTEAVQDPNDPNHIFVGSTGQGLYEFNNGKFSKLHTWNNSGLTSILNDSEDQKYNYVRISALQYDKQGNLWMANNETDTILKILDKNGNWFGLYYSEMAGLPTYKQLKFDNKGRIWINSSRGKKPGLFCIDLNGTLKDNTDDKIKYTGSVWTNQDGSTEEIYDLFFYEFDLYGDIWIGTNRGIFVLRDPDSFLSDPYPIFERIKINRNDGSGLADYLFNGVMTTAIYIDQGNRKWIGTLDDGVFLINADGTKTLEHFTTSNSPLPSNNILSITENGQDGSLFFGTNLGMVEYGGQARDPEETLFESNIIVYPNPVKPDFDGYVTITGLTEWSSIRILTNSGRLIHQGKSNGGSYSWNLTDMNGRLVPSGVYHAVITNQENNKSESVSITVIR